MVTIDSASSIFGKLKTGDSSNDNDVSGIENLFASFFSIAESETSPSNAGKSKEIVEEMSAIFTEIKSSLAGANDDFSEQIFETDGTVTGISANILRMYETYKTFISQEQSKAATASIRFVLDSKINNLKKDAANPGDLAVETKIETQETILIEKTVSKDLEPKDSTKSITEFSSNALKNLTRDLRSTKGKVTVRTDIGEKDQSTDPSLTKSSAQSNNITQKMTSALKGEQNVTNNKLDQNTTVLTNDSSKVETLAESSSQSNKTSTSAKLNSASADYTGKSNVVQNQLKLFDQKWDKNLAKIIERAIASGKEKINISLEPKRLGKMQISLSMVNNQTSIAIHTENIAASLILTGSEDRLSQMFEATGLKLSNFQANSNNGKSGNRDPNSSDKSDKGIEFKKEDAEGEVVDSITDLEATKGRKVINVIA